MPSRWRWCTCRLQTLVSDFQNHQTVRRRRRESDTGWDADTAGDGAAAPRVARRRRHQRINWSTLVISRLNREYTASFISLWTIVHGQPYIEAGGDFRSCDGHHHPDNFTISTGDRLNMQLRRLAVATFNVQPQ